MPDKFGSHCQSTLRKLYKLPSNKPQNFTHNNRNKNVDTTPRYKNDNQSGQFGNQRTMTVAGARETVGGHVVQQSGIQCFNCKEFGHFAKECRKPKWVKDITYHKEKILLGKQAEKVVQLQAEQSDWLADTDEEIDEQKLEAHYNYKAKIQEVPNTDSDMETVDSNVIPDLPDMCDNYIQNDQNDVECDDERVALANLIANLKLDVDENKKIQKQLKKANASLTQELKECKSTLVETSRTLGESNSIRDSCLVHSKQTMFERYKALMTGSWTTTYLNFCKEKASNVFQKEREQYLEIQDLNAQLQDKNIAISELKKFIEKCKGKSVETKFDKPSVVRKPNAQRISKPSVLGNPTPFSNSLERKNFSTKKSVPKTNESEGVIHKTNVSTPQLRSTQMKDKVVPSNSHVKDKKTEVEDHHRISSTSNKTKSVTASDDNLKSRTSNVNAVCATCGKCVFKSIHDVCVSKCLNDVNARTKKPKVVPISIRKPKSQANKSVATPHKKTVAS
ncbi:retrovirus-related pol polyprotein from transposon TNT 1-94 [Tanacetum coccineum]